MQSELEDWDDLVGIAHDIWAVAQLGPGEGIVDGVDRINTILATRPPAPEDAGTVDRVARAIVAELARQDDEEGTWPCTDGKLAYLDQGEVDMFAVARAALSALSRFDGETGKDMGK